MQRKKRWISVTNMPQTLYHYTSLETLALILTNKSLCFNTLLNVDDIEEAETSDMGLFGKYVYVSCWTDEAQESIAMWQLYIWFKRHCPCRMIFFS